VHLQGNPVSAPYLRLTIELMRRFGVTVGEEGHTFRVEPQVYAPVSFTVEPDWSAASYWYEMAAIAGQAEIEMKGLAAKSLQGDAAVVHLFTRLGVETVFTSDGVRLKVQKGALPVEMTGDFTDIPDVAQTLVVTCVAMGVHFYFSGLKSLKIKETDRLQALTKELHRFGYVLEESEGGVLSWDGGRCEAEKEPLIATFDDHRMAMAFAPLTLCVPGGVRIEDTGVVSKSYPLFWDDMRRAGFHIADI